MSSQTVAAAPRRQFWRPRFSLRALLITITVLCLVFAPVLPELNRADRLARQVKIIEEMGGQCVFVDRPWSFSASLVQRFWPVKVAHLEHDLLMAEFNEWTVDLAKLRETPDIRGVCFNECLFVVPDDDPEVRLPRIECVQLQERDYIKGGKPNQAILRRFPAFFPNLRKAELMGVPQEEEFSKLKSLQRIVLSFDPHQGAITNEGIALFRKLPIVELEYGYSSVQPLAEGMQRLIDSWPGPGPGKSFRQTDEGVEFLQKRRAAELMLRNSHSH